jgi:hypothetical protein
MNTFGAFDLFSPSTWFGGDDTTPEISTGGASFDGNSNDLFGFNFDNFFGGGSSTAYQNPGLSDADLQARLDYINAGGIMGYQPTVPGTTPSSFLDGFNLTDFLNGITDVAQAGFGIYAGIQNIINEQNPSDRLVFLPGTNTPVIQRTQGGGSTYIPVDKLYPSLAPQIRQVQNQNSWIGPALIAGVLGIGLILILKKD